ncbi:hypothetical protein [Cellulophaga lytica]|uniref:hypothetical protein n=1 Tax=Cellulophaga lytica TaxID=979 RepID=UPI003CE45A70
MFQIVKETGWTWHYILWKVTRANIMLMMADRSHFKSGEKQEQEAIPDTGANLLKRYKAKQRK